MEMGKGLLALQLSSTEFQIHVREERIISRKKAPSPLTERIEHI